MRLKQASTALLLRSLYRPSNVAYFAANGMEHDTNDVSVHVESHMLINYTLLL